MMFYVIFNPGSRGGKSRKALREITDFLQKSGTEYEIHKTESLKHAAQLAAEACRLKADTIVAVGGDGTINQVISGMYNADGTKKSNTRFAVIYTGTSPDFCKSYGLPFNNVTDSLKILLSGQRADIPIARICYTKADTGGAGQTGPNKSRHQPSDTVGYFACAANIGLGPTVARVANSGIRKWLGDTIGTFTGLLKAFFTLKPMHYTLISPSESIELQDIISLTIGLTRYVASGIQVRPPDPLNKNQFYVLGVKKMGLHKIPYAVKKIYSGKPMSSDLYFYFDIRETISISTGNRPPELEYDGDPKGWLPCEIEIAKDRLTVLGAKL